MSSAETKPGWQRLLQTARALIRQVNSEAAIIEQWTLGGGTALMLRIGHRLSRDIDIFLSDPQQLSFLDPTKRDLQFETRPSDHLGDGARFLRFAFADLGEIDFIVAGALTSSAATSEMVEGESLALETVPEIIAKKIYHRGKSIKPRDIFDIAAAAEEHTDEIVAALREHRDAVQNAISTLEKLKPDFVDAAISQLAIEPRYTTIAKIAQKRAGDVLRAV